jgi:CDP-diacylglycerol--glycerol-3-phosphate 3-phosphatidyltransferase
MSPPAPREIWNLPNAISVSRILAAPLLILMLLDPDEFWSVVAAAVFLLVCLTDWLDGYLARRLNVVTVFGKFLDPLADKLLIVTALIMLIPIERAPAWMVSLIVVREIAVTGLRTVAVRDGLVIQASVLGKTKTVLQICAVALLLVHYPFFGVDFQFAGAVVLWVAFIVTLASGIDYFVKFFRQGGG